MSKDSYRALAAPISFEHEEKRSTFTAHLFPVDSREQALSCLEQVKNTFPGASHYCWAYILGAADKPVSVAFSDDGEPSGTAGKPMLNVLTHRSAGDCFAVIVRIFGGTKLGAGGLVRAYGSAVSQALDGAEWKQITKQIPFSIALGFSLEERVRHRLQLSGVTVDHCEYGAGVTLFAQAPEDELVMIADDVQQLTSGTATFQRL